MIGWFLGLRVGGGCFDFGLCLVVVVFSWITAGFVF